MAEWTRALEHADRCGVDASEHALRVTRVRRDEDMKMTKMTGLAATAGGLTVALMAAGLPGLAVPGPAAPVAPSGQTTGERRVGSGAAARRSPAPAGAGQRAPFTPGETLVYDVRWTLLSAGSLTLTLTHDAPARAYRISAATQVAEALASLYALDYQAETVVDAGTLLPRRASVQQQEGRRRRTRITVFDQAARRAHFEQLGGRQADLDLPAGTHDALSALYTLRARPALAAGARITLPVCDSGRLYTLEVGVARGETLDTPAGRFETWRLTPVSRRSSGEAEQARLSMWLSTDQRRVPVRFDVELAVGRFEIVLREITAGRAR